LREFGYECKRLQEVRLQNFSQTADSKYNRF
jgi:hypothetical protein